MHMLFCFFKLFLIGCIGLIKAACSSVIALTATTCIYQVCNGCSSNYKLLKIILIASTYGLTFLLTYFGNYCYVGWKLVYI